MVLAIASWLAMQVPIGMALGWYIRRARTLMAPDPVRTKRHAPRGRRHFAGCTPPALLRG
jgi:hypothetical protein